MSSKGVIRTQIREDGRKVTVRRTQPDESEVLARNLREQNNSSHRRFSARVTDIQRLEWKQQGREDLLRGEVRALEKYVASPEGRKYSTMPRGRSRAFSVGGIKK
jgi:Asp/Glu/hydantoin racemase